MAVTPKDPVSYSMFSLTEGFSLIYSTEKTSQSGAAPGLWTQNNKSWTSIAPNSDFDATGPASATPRITAHLRWEYPDGNLQVRLENGSEGGLLKSTTFTGVVLPPASTITSGTTIATGTTAEPTKVDSSKADPTPPAIVSSISGTTPTMSAPASSSQTTDPTILPSKGGVKPAAAAGIGVGCFLAGVLIAALLAWLAVTRRRYGSNARHTESSTVALMHREKGPVTQAVSASSGSPTTSALGNLLPQPLEDKAVSGEISKISNLIKNHVQSYYHTRAVSAGLIDYDDLQALGENLPVSVGTLSTLLNNSATREIALRFCLAWVVVSRIQLNDSSNITFLPPEVAKCMQSMDLSERDSRVHSLPYAKWRALTWELLQPTYTRNPFTPNDGRMRNIKAAATLLDSVLKPFADSRMDDAARSRNLEEILKRSAQFSFTLFSQASVWNFDWHDGQGIKGGSLCIFPALVQVADENGQPIHPPRPFSEAVNRRLDG